MKKEFDEYPEIDSDLQKYLGSDKFRYRTKITADGSTKHLIVERKYGEFWLKDTLKENEMAVLNPEEVTTFLVHKLLLESAIKRRVLLVVLFIATLLALVLFLDLALSVYLFENLQMLISGITIVTIFCAFTYMFATVERHVDDRVYTIFPNLISVLQKMENLQEDPLRKRSILMRIKRLQDIDAIKENATTNM